MVDELPAVPLQIYPFAHCPAAEQYTREEWGIEREDKLTRASDEV
jgi:hypothetical protein